MKYDITKSKAPSMPNLGHGTECIKILLSQASKDMHEPLVPMLFPILGAHISGAEFQYPDLTWKELCGQMANLVAESGGNKGQLSHLVEAICRDFRQHDVLEENTTVSKKSSSKKAVEVQLIPKGSMLEDVEADDEVRRLVHNMMELYEGTTIMNIVMECQREYQERYFSMKTNDWRHLLREYVRKVTERPNLQEEEVFRYVMAG